MNQNTNLTVAKICHEMANYLSVLTFIKEDIADNATDDEQEMFTNIELLTHTMDFFRSIYSDNINSEAIINVLENIYSLKGLHLSISYGALNLLSEKVRGAVCAVLYTIMKTAKPRDTVAVYKKTNDIVIDVPQNRMLSNGVKDALSANSVDNNVFNILINYAKSIAASDGYAITLNGNLNQVVIWKK